MKQKSLISKTMTQFFICTGVIFLLSAPLFYLLTRHFYAEDLIDVIQAVERGQGIPSLDLERDIMVGVMMQFVLTFAVLSVAMFITVRFITRRLWQPFDSTLRVAEQFNLAHGSVPVFADTDIAEFSRLNESLEKLMRNNSESFRIQKEFTENASHELQTPLAVTRSKLDLLMQEELTEIQAGIVADLYQLNTRMGRLNRNLLLLAKIDNNQYCHTETVCVQNYVAGLIPSYRILESGISVTLIESQETKWSAQVNTVLFECLLNDLVVNALRNSSEGNVEIDVSVENRIKVSNVSTDGKPLDSQMLFQRFNTRAAAKGGNGLGLAIVKAICDLHGWTIAYSFESRRHRFTITIP